MSDDASPLALRLPRLAEVPSGVLDLEQVAWHRAARTELVRVEDGGRPRQPTVVRLGWTPELLLVRFDCVDLEPWATLAGRDEPLWQEEVVELFLAAGETDPATYVELEVNPLGALFDALIANPGLERAALSANLAFDWPEIRWKAEALRQPRGWWAALALPWHGLPGAVVPARTGVRLRANLFRIDRPHDGPPEHSAWSPTRIVPADFHRPRRFGTLILGD